MGEIVVNKSASPIPVYNSNYSVQIGQIDLREVCAVYSACVQYPYGQVTLGGQNYFTF